MGTSRRSCAVLFTIRRLSDGTTGRVVELQPATLLYRPRSASSKYRQVPHFSDYEEAVNMPAMTAQMLSGDVDALLEQIVGEGLVLEPRCRVCRNDDARHRVNTMLTQGQSYASIMRALADHNQSLDRRDRITIDSVRNHTARHFPVQNTARVAYREILERRAKDNGVDFINATGTAITMLGYLETVMVRGYQTLIDEDTVVTPMQGMQAALKLHELQHRDDPHKEIARMSLQLDQIITAVRDVVPEDIWPVILERLDDTTAADTTP